MEKRKDKKSNNGHSEAIIEDYGDYVTRCICEFQHDDGYMICCDGCGVWQHIECMQVDTKNLPENYLCELCDPRPVDRKRARQAQIKKREDLSDLDDDDDDSPPPPPGRKGIPPATPSIGGGGGAGGVKKKRKRGKSTETKPEPVSKSTKTKKDIPQSASIKKAKKKPVAGKGGQTPGGGGGGSRVSNIQSLLNAASLLDSVGGGAESSPSGGRSKEHHHSRSTDIWNANLSPWSDKYDTIDHNRYSEPIRTFISSHLSQLKSEAVVYSHDEYLTWDQRSQPQCSVSEVGRRRKGLIANANIPEDELVIEYMGKITVKQLVINDVAPESKSLWRHKPCPFVYCYDKISGVDMCIDARNSGTIARFMRRSCSPNSEIRHFFVSNELHFGVYAVVNIAEGEEITLPFDFKFEKCEYMMECACGQPWTMCLVARAPKRPAASSSTTSTPGSTNKSISAAEHVTRAPSRQQSLTILSSAVDEDSNSSWTSSSGRKRARHHHAHHGSGAGSGSGHGPLSPGSKSAHHHHHHHHHQASLEGSESEEDAAKEKEKRRKSLSREERKTEQIWKLVEKMEASQQRKQRQQLLSEGSLESDPLLSPSHSQNTTSHLFTSYKATPTSTGGKERKSSNNSRKTSLYPGSKMRLSSVSSTDALSPCDLTEAFSPPFTPGLATGPDAALTPSHVHPSPAAPLLSPPPTVSSHKPTFIVTPDLHPKYLFANFALPYKKAFLKQWEDEQHNRSSHAHPYWTNGHTYHLTGEHMRKRVRGSLKHRWLKQHREERERGQPSPAESIGGRREGDTKINDDKENVLRSPAPLSHKKLMLLRWERSVLDKTSLPLSPPPSPHSPHPHPPTANEDKQPIKRRNSPLFEELSDEEFEETRKTADSADGEKTTQGAKTPPIPASVRPEGGRPDGESGSEIMDLSTAAANDSHKLTDDNLSSVSDTSLASCSGDEGVGPRTPPTEPNEPSSMICTSDVSSDVDGEPVVMSSQEDAPPNQSEKTGGGDKASTQPEERDSDVIPANQPKSGGDVPGNQTTPTAMEETTAAASEDVLKSADSAELSGVLSSDTATSENASILVGEDVPHPLLSETASQQDSAPPSPTAVGTPTKTPGKKKINLSEYRNRVRKPVERKAAPEKSSPPQSTSSSSSTSSLLSTPSFLSQSSLSSRIFLSSPSLSYPPPLKLSSTPGGSLGALPLSSSAAGMVGVASGSGHTHFEPVSPDEDERPANEDPSAGVAASAGSVVVGSLHPQPQLMSVPPVSSYPHTQSILGPGDRAVMLGPGSTYLQQAPPTGPIVAPSSQPPPPLVHMVQPGVLQAPPPPPPPGGQYAMWPPASGAPIAEQAIDPRKGLIPIPGHAMGPQQHAGLYPIPGGPLIQQNLMMGPRGRGEFHHHGYMGHPPPPPGAPVYRPRPPGPGPGGNYY